MGRKWLAVVGVDGSPAAQRALRWAVQQAAERKGAVHLVHAWARPRGVTPGPPAYPHEARDAAEALLLAAVRALPDRHGVRISTQAVAGQPVDVLVRAAIGADALVLGRDGGQDSIYGRCVRTFSCPVMLGGYPTPDEALNERAERPASTAAAWVLSRVRAAVVTR